MPKLRFQTVIQRQPEAIYQVLLDLTGYKVWLPSSNMHSETTLTSDYPIRVGTTYVDRGPSSVMQGEIIELEPARKIVFRQTTSPQRRSFLASKLDITTRYTLEPIAEGTRVKRELTLHVGGLFFVLQVVLIRLIRQENERILAALKNYMDARVS
ncbi:SRPBCC family protein [Dictyobacter kobayashii]|uniref:Polyketide cyclase n=1 Tax=Dictyobacter kobayashii TaxID=2014872 RepID=A0A402AUD3_9CHLR|nr:SRPBCC family protein [Dictyobacter kobayashii]GCE22704.1 hypothetical protein KDK_65040 [Dictyobacter kobayashii]